MISYIELWITLILGFGWMYFWLYIVDLKWYPSLIAGFGWMLIVAYYTYCRNHKNRTRNGVDNV